jgi:hypothetical protein
MVDHPPSAPEASAMYIHGPLRYLVAQGFSDTDASQLFEAVFALSFGHAMLTTKYPTMTGEDVPDVRFTEESFERTVRVLLSGYGAYRQGA